MPPAPLNAALQMSTSLLIKPGRQLVCLPYSLGKHLVIQ